MTKGLKVMIIFFLVELALVIVDINLLNGSINNYFVRNSLASDFLKTGNGFVLGLGYGWD